MYVENKILVAVLIVAAVGLSAVAGLLVASALAPPILEPIATPQVAAASPRLTETPTQTVASEPSPSPSTSDTPLQFTATPTTRVVPTGTAVSSGAPTQVRTATAASTVTPAQDTGEQTYTVQVGDTLVDIAEQFGVSTDAIRRRNNLASDTLRVGWELIIPPPDTDTVETDPGEQVYVVQSGDTLLAISQQFDVSVEIIRARNGLSGNELQVGQELIIPSPSATITLPTPTPVPTTPPTAPPAPTVTPLPPTPSTSSSATPPPTATLPAYEAPVLLAPENGASHAYPVTLQWSWNGTLNENEYFDVRFWQEGKAHTGVAWTKSPQLRLSGAGLQGSYFWSVAVIRGEDGQWLADLSPEAPPRTLTLYSNGGGGSSGNGSSPTPGATPTR